MELTGITQGDKFRLVVKRNTSHTVYLRWETSAMLVHDMIINEGLDDIYWCENPSTFVKGQHTVMDREIRVPVSSLPSFSSPEPWGEAILEVLFVEGFRTVVETALEYEFPGNFVAVIREFYIENVDSNSPTMVFSGAFVKFDAEAWPNS